MGQSLYINADASNLLAARVRGATDLRNQDFTQFVAGDSLELDLYLVGTSGPLNIQDYAEVRIGLGNLDSRPESGNYLVGGSDTLAYDHTASELEAVVESQVAEATVTKLTDFVFKVQFDAVGAQTIPSLDFVNLQPRSTVSVTRLVTGDATTKESWLWRIFRDPVAFTSTFTDIADNGIRGTLSLATSGIYDLLAQNEDVRTFFEVELTDTSGNVRTFLQAKVKLNGEVIGHNFSGSIPTSPTNSPEANAFLESFPDPTIVGNLTVEGGVTTSNISADSNISIEPNQSQTDGPYSVSITGGQKSGSGPQPGGNVYLTGGAGSDSAGGDVIISSGAGGSGSKVEVYGASEVSLSSSDYINLSSPQISIGSNPLTDDSISIGSALSTVTINGTVNGIFESGSFTPFFHIDGAVEQGDYAIQQGYYSKVGRTVTVNLFIKITNFDAAFKTAALSSEFGIWGLPYSAEISGVDGPDVANVTIQPKKGWQNLGDKSYVGSIGASPDGKLWAEKNVGQGEFGPQPGAGVGWNYDRITVGDFDFHPFNFTADGVKAFTFQISGSYITSDD